MSLLIPLFGMFHNVTIKLIVDDYRYIDISSNCLGCKKTEKKNLLDFLKKKRHDGFNIFNSSITEDNKKFYIEFDMCNLRYTYNDYVTLILDTNVVIYGFFCYSIDGSNNFFYLVTDHDKVICAKEDKKQFKHYKKIDPSILNDDILENIYHDRRKMLI